MIFEQNLQFNIYYLLALINNNEIIFIKNKKLIIDSDLIVTQSNIFFIFQQFWVRECAESRSGQSLRQSTC